MIESLLLGLWIDAVVFGVGMLVLFFRKQRRLPPPTWASDRRWLKWWWRAESEFRAAKRLTA